MLEIATIITHLASDAELCYVRHSRSWPGARFCTHQRPALTLMRVGVQLSLRFRIAGATVVHLDQRT